MLQEELPLFFKILNDLGSFPKYMLPIFQELKAKAEVPFSGRESHCLPSVKVVSNTGYFPALPEQCVRGHYVMDSKPLSKQVLNSCDKSAVARSRWGSLTPGLFLLNCPHGMKLLKYILGSDKVFKSFKFKK